MTPAIFQEFERILADKDVGDRVLEIGAVPTLDSLLNIKSLASAKERIGINLDGGDSYTIDLARDVSQHRNDYRIIKANANDMNCFEDSTFDTILCNSVFEHDKYFWKSVAEIRRVAKNGALVVVGTPGYDDLENVQVRNWTKEQYAKYCENFRKHVPGTPVLRIHNWPGDYYRFSPQAYKDVIFDGMKDVEVYSIMVPPRIIGIGYNVK